MAGATNPGNIGHSWVKSLWIVDVEAIEILAGENVPIAIEKRAAQVRR
jgi:hypothetical protein